MGPRPARALGPGLGQHMHRNWTILSGHVKAGPGMIFPVPRDDLFFLKGVYEKTRFRTNQKSSGKNRFFPVPHQYVSFINSWEQYFHGGT